MAVPSFYNTAEENHQLREICRWIVDIMAVLSLAALLVFFFFGSVNVSGQAMEPVLSDGDVVLVNRMIYSFREPKRLELIEFTVQDADGRERTAVRRVIGLPGETVQIKEEKLYIDGRRLYLENGLDQAAIAGLAENEITLGEDEYFVLGDNRNNSEDSRYSSIGTVKRSDIIGLLWFRIAPFENFGLLSQASD